MAEQRDHNVFVINDIALLIPPTNISVRKEDLTYQWRTLRSTVATKIASGRGQTFISVKIPWLIDSQILTLHRLLVELRNSPFCYVENAYIRDSLVPDWSPQKNMALVLLGVNIAPMAGTSNGWWMELEFQWFNYEPFSSNYLFRDDWLTEPIAFADTSFVNEWNEKLDWQVSSIQYGIGWKMEGDKKISRPSIVKVSDTESTLRRYDAIQQAYQTKNDRTIFEMEQMHDGQIFDLLPLPGNMQPARAMGRASESLVYKRFINLLQRDSMKTHFGIDVEQDLLDEAKKWPETSPASRPRHLLAQFFSAAYNTGPQPLVYRLDSGHVKIEQPDGRDDIATAVARCRARWEAMMLQHNGQVQFSFDIYKELQLPESIQRYLDKAKKSLTQNVAQAAALSNPNKSELLASNLYGKNDAVFVCPVDGGGTIEIPYRKGFTHAANKYIPVAGTIGDVTAVQHKKYGAAGNHGGMIYRSDEILKSIWGKNEDHLAKKLKNEVWSQMIKGSGPAHSRIHYGTDFYLATGQDLFAVTYGKVTNVNGPKNVTTTSSRWKWLNVKTGETGKIEPGSSLEAQRNVALEIGKTHGWLTGTKAYRNFANPDIFFYYDPGSGGYSLTIEHTEADDSKSYSRYMHLSEIFVNKGDEITEAGLVSNGVIQKNLDYVKGRVPIAKSGASSFVNVETLTKGLRAHDERYRSSNVTLPYDFSYTPDGFNVPPHLHFEYWESTTAKEEVVDENGILVEEEATDEPTAVAKADNQRRTVIPVDVRWSYESAVDDRLPYITPGTKLKKVIVEEAQKIQDSTKETIQPNELDALAALYEAMVNAGWRYEDGASNVQNVWKQSIQYQVKPSNVPNVWKEFLDGQAEDSSPYLRRSRAVARGDHGGSDRVMTLDDIVFSSFMGGYRHITSSIPILGQEWPTHQHLGSTEPLYSFEFQVVDTATVFPSPDGLGDQGKVLELMRSKLMAQARKFRLVPDSWSIRTDTLITRLLGTTHDRDWTITNDGYEKHYKRTMISRQANATVEGNPGLSVLTMELEETNPYKAEVIQSTAPKKPEVEKARRDILNGLVNLDFLKRYEGNVVLPFMIAQMNGIKIIDTPKFSVTNDLKNAFSASAGPNGVRITTTLSEDFLDRFGVKADPVNTIGSEVDALFGQDTSVLSLDSLVGNSWTAEVRRAPVEGTVVYPSSARVETRTPMFKSGVSSELLSIDATQLVTKYPELADVDWNKVYESYKLLEGILTTADVILAEEMAAIGSSGNAESDGYLPGAKDQAYSLPEVMKELYDLPVIPQQFLVWQSYFENFVKLGNYPDALSRNPCYMKAGSPISLRAKKFLERAISNRNLKVTQSLLSHLASGGPANGALDSLVSTTSTFLDSKLSLGGITGMTLLESSTQNLVTNKDYWRETFIEALLFSLPFEITTTEFIERKLGFFPRRLLGEGGLEGQMGLSESYQHWMKSNNLLWSYNSVFGETLDLFAGTFDLANTGSLDRQWKWYGGPYTLDYGKNYVFGNYHFGMEDNSAEGSLLDTITNTIGNTFQNAYTPTIPVSGRIDNWYQPNLDISLQDPYTADSRKKVVASTTGAISYKILRVWEEQKIQYLKGILAEVADTLRQDYSLLKLMGLEKYSIIENSNDYIGSEAYPDLQLPPHPYYGTMFETSPDFYLWNIYEDGGVQSAAYQKQVENEANTVLNSAIESLERLKAGEQFTANFEPTVVTPESTYVKIFPEANNGMGVPTSPTEEMAKADSSFFEKFREEAKGGKFPEELEKNLFEASAGKTGDEAFYTNVVKPPKIKIVDGDGKEREVYQYKLSDTDGNPFYRNRAGKAEYEALQEAFDNSTQLFGSKAGYTGQLITEENLPGMKDRLSDTAAAVLDQYTHAFDPETLRKIAYESSRDMVSQKRTMKRAFPTFKVMFVEEDENESRFLNFDDFYTYNGIKEFSYVESKRDAASTAIITMQNVNGTLDGSSRDLVTDLDYFSSTATKVITERDRETAELQDDRIARGTNKDQPFGALVLRPGMNIQLRVGYSNDPRNLEVLISGRAVDIAWNVQGDLVEVTVQSFGTELTAMIKGTGHKDDREIYYTTHQLLCSLMLESELAHFGRWEFGQKFQIGEAKDASFDVYNYAREGYIGKFAWTDWATRTFYENPLIAIALTTAASVALALPIGRGVTRVGGRLFKALTAGKTILGSKLAYNVGTTGIVAGEEVIEKTVKEVIEKGATKAAIGRGLGTLAKADLGSGVTATMLKTFRSVLGKQERKLELEAMKKLSTELAGKTREEQAFALKEFYSSFQNRMAGRQIANNLFDITTLPDIRIWQGSNWKDWAWAGAKVGRFGFGRLFYTSVTGAAVAGGALAIDGLDMVGESVIGRKWRELSNFFSQTQASLFLTPQDDNIYAPSPKDYMVLGEATSTSLMKVGAVALSRIFTEDSTSGEFVFNLSNTQRFLDKRVDPAQCRYVLSGSTIWNVFYEMTLRHPGWVFAARPYGRDFRYTMFFGIPSQRYWSKPGSGQFIERMNRLKTAIDDGVTAREYQNLYGDKLEDGRDLITEIKTLDSSGSTDNQTAFMESLTSRAIKEYLRGLELRFVPFRRYHMLSSDYDIIHNGIRSSEFGVINAVDVAYYQSGVATDEFQSPEGTVTIKASTSIPPNMISMKPIMYPNVKGYSMALRYGMGELIHTMKNMYRGELLVLGNPRIRPWDICILMDAYNDMVGPIEVEQVVHNFSYEMGFTTEIKPGALVIGNEISTWPVVEAMKLWGLAALDAQRFMGAKSENGNVGGILDIAELFNSYGDERSNTEIMDRYVRYFGVDTAKQIVDTTKTITALESDEQSLVSSAMDMGKFVSGSAGEGARALADTLQYGRAAVHDLDNSNLGLALAFASPSAYIQLHGGLAVAETGARAISEASAVGTLVSALRPTSLAWMVTSAVLLAKVSEEEAVMIIPLIKSGNPIVGGLSYKDPAMMWKSYRGQLKNYIDDSLDGTRDAILDAKRYGTALWRSFQQTDYGMAEPTLTGN